MADRVIEVRQTDRKPLYLVLRGELELGRDCDGLLLADDEVSRRHALLADGPGGVVVTDLGSTNGTFVDGVRVGRHAAVPAGGVVRLGTTEIRVVGAEPAPSGARATTAAASGPRGTVVAGRSPAPAGASGAEAGPDTATQAVVGPASTTTSSALRATSIERVAESVAEAPAQVAQLAGGDDTVTIVFSDIESSTERAMALGDQRWYEVLGAHNGIVRTRLREFGGREVKSQGDGFMLTFPSARRAVQCCIAVQRDLAAYAAANPDTGVRVRMGVHTGEAIVDEGGDLFGKHIIVAARIANLARGGQVLASGLTCEITSSRGDLAFAAPDEVELKGIGGTYQVCDVLWDPEPG